MSRRTVAVLMGGASPEHDISLLTGRNVVAALDRSKYDVRPVVVGRDGLWALDESTPPVSLGRAAEFLQREVDVVFVAMHGPYGEDGRIQGFLDLLGLPYTGSGVGASSVAMDKVICKDVVAQRGVQVPPHVLITAREWQADQQTALGRVEHELGFPCVVKPTGQGSSVATAIPKDVTDLSDQLPIAFEHGLTVMVEKFVAGTEISVGVLGSVETESVRALPVAEIVPVMGEFYDLKSKYTDGGAREIIPARITFEQTERAQQIAVTVHTALGCRGMSRSDMIVAEHDVYFIEVNSIPGMTDLSILPQQAAAVGISFGELVDMLIEDAVAVHSLRTGMKKARD